MNAQCQYPDPPAVADLPSHAGCHRVFGHRNPAFLRCHMKWQTYGPRMSRASHGHRVAALHPLFAVVMGKPQQGTARSVIDSDAKDWHDIMGISDRQSQISQIDILPLRIRYCVGRADDDHNGATPDPNTNEHFLHNVLYSLPTTPCVAFCTGVIFTSAKACSGKDHGVAAHHTAKGDAFDNT